MPIPFTVSQLARVMDVSRQAAQSTARELEVSGFILLEMNLRNRKSPIVTLTALGRARLEDAEQIEQRWIAAVTRGFTDHLTALSLHGLQTQQVTVLQAKRPRQTEFFRGTA